MQEKVRNFDNKAFIKFKFQELLKTASNGKNGEYTEDNIKKINAINFN
jgi:hypothetical protein